MGEHLREIRTILVATGLTAESAGAVLTARRLADRFGARLHVVHVVSLPSRRIREALAGVVERQREVAAEELERFASSHEAGDATLHVREGDPEREILGLRRELDADLLVMGRYGKGGPKRGVLGSIAASVVRHCRVPALIVDPTFRGEFAQIAVASNLDADSEIELRRGLWLGRMLGVDSIRLISAFELPVGYHTVLTEEQAVAKLEEVCRAHGRELVEKVRREGDPEVEVVCVEGAATRAIPAACDRLGVEVLVLSTHLHRSEGAGVLLGRTTERILHAANCSVWAETTPELSRGWWDAIRHLFD